MKRGIFSDELSPAPGQACEMAALHGVHWLEFRMWYAQRAPQGMRQADMDAVRAGADSWGLRFSSVSPGLLKILPDAPERPSHTGDLLDKSLDLADTLGAKILVTFTPIVPEDQRGQWDEWLVDELRTMGERAGARGITVVVENEPVCVGSSSPLVAQLVQTVGHPAVRMNWDPGNDASSGQSTGPEAWPLVAPVLGHVHVKDYYQGKPQVADLGEGYSDWRWILAKLKEVDYQGFLILEPHNVPLLVSAMRAIMVLRKRLAEAGVEW